jgi:hypothetical protein
MSIPESEKSAFFDELRASYPVRREFRNTTLSLEQYSEILAKKLSGIGFSVKR